MKPKMILMMGGQGVGKGTHARRLIARDGYDYIETGAMLRGLPPESRVARIMARGELVPDADLFDLVATEISKSGMLFWTVFPAPWARPNGWLKIMRINLISVLFIWMCPKI